MTQIPNPVGFQYCPWDWYEAEADHQHSCCRPIGHEGACMCKCGLVRGMGLPPDLQG